MSDPMAGVEVTHRPERERYELLLDGEVVGVAYYRPGAEGEPITLTHTEVDRSLSGRGLGSHLAEQVLADLRRRGLRVRTDCPFMAGHIAAHPEHQDLLA